jgi:uncharacterized DUF497 family protein
MHFEWDEAKWRINIAKHGIDFRDALHLFDGRPRLDIESPRLGEHRVLSIAILDRRHASMIWVWRGDDVVRIISVRSARRAEERQYRQVHG